MPESVIEEIMNLCTWVIKKMNPKKWCPLMAAVLNSNMASKITIF